MTKSRARLAVALGVLAASLLLAACSSGQQESGAQQGAAATVSPIAAQTALEKRAVALAARPEGRKWGAGNPNASAEATGDPFLVGYYVTLYDGQTQYVVCVIDGKPVPYFGVTGPKWVKSPRNTFNTPIPATTEQQKAAVSAAQSYVATVAPNAKPGGIGMYLVYFPLAGEGKAAGYPSVAIFAKPAPAGMFASGGPQFR